MVSKITSSGKSFSSFILLKGSHSEISLRLIKIIKKVFVSVQKKKEHVELEG